jgi:hypothetical protein
LPLQVLQQAVGLCIAEAAGISIPKESFLLITIYTADPGALEEGGIEGCPHTDRGVPISHFDGALIEESRRGDVTGVQRSIAAQR